MADTVERPEASGCISFSLSASLVGFLQSSRVPIAGVEDVVYSVCECILAYDLHDLVKK